MESNTTNILINPKRLLRLFIYENKSSMYYAKIATCIIAYTVYVLAIRSSSFFSYSIFNECVITILIIVSPFLFYSEILSKKSRALYVMLPASNIEKYLSMLLNTLVVAPLTVIAITTAINFILTDSYSHSDYLTTEMYYRDSLYYTLFVLGITNIGTYLLIIYKTSPVLKSIVYTFIIGTAEYLFADFITTIFSADGYVSPTKILYTLAIFGACNIAVLQILIYHSIKRIKA